MSDIIIKDANGKEFTVNTAKICDITGDYGVGEVASVNDATQQTQNRLSVEHKTKFVDSMGKEVNVHQMLADMKNGKTNIVALDIDVEATHSGPNHNYCIYYEDSMEKDCESFVNPFKKPVLKNHDSYRGEPLGRIQNASFAPSQIATDRSAINLKCHVTDQDAIEKFLDERYNTVSIGGTMGTVICNICGKTILKDGKFKFCGHWRGETYKDQICYWGARDIEYHEVSVVNTPADDFAQVSKVTVVTDEDKNKDKGGSDNMDENNATNTHDSTNTASTDANDVKKTISDMIDSLLGSGTQQQAAPTTNTQDSTSETNTGTTPSNNSTETNDNLKEQLDAANATIQELKNQLDSLKQEKEKAVTEAEDAKKEAESMKDMCLTLASSNKSLMVDNIIAKECAANLLAQDKVADRKVELLSKSMKDLNTLSDSVKDRSTQAPQRQMPHVDNPALADRSEDNGSTTQDNQQQSSRTNDSVNVKKHVDDYASEIIKKLYK